MRIADLKANPKNPRVITDAKLKQLKKSMLEFGDLSGIVFNRKTGQVVGGTQRTKNIDATAEVHYTKKYIKPSRTGTVAEGYILQDGEKFAYREVEWDRHREMAANVAANKGAGEWDLPELTAWMKELGSFDVDFDLDLTMFDEDELTQFDVLVPELEHTAAGEAEEAENEDPPEEIEEPEKLEGEVQLFNSDCIDVLRSLPNNTFDSLVTDPPAGIAFMGKEWDKDKGGRDGWVAWLTDVMKECYRVMKPGAHGLVWAIPRTSHWTATALENAGFEVRDVVTHLFGSGFPKSLDISKAIDKAAGAQREVVREISGAKPGTHGGSGAYGHGEDRSITAPSTDAAKQWSGWGTALKPASEHWLLVRKPISEKTVAANVLKWGTGALNIDGCRIETAEKLSSGRHVTGDQQGPSGYKTTNRTEYAQASQGRFPANLILDEEAGEMLDGQSVGYGRSNGNKINDKSGHQDVYVGGTLKQKISGPCYSDKGGASRFFYCAKASKSERNTHCRELPRRQVFGDEGGTYQGLSNSNTPDHNHHPTVKPISLMRYLARLITPPEGLVLDTFMGSGSTGVAALKENFRFVGIEREKEYFDICRKRLNYKNTKTELVVKRKTATQSKRSDA